MHSVKEIRLRTAGCLGSKRVFVSSDCSGETDCGVAVSHDTQNERKNTACALSFSHFLSLCIISVRWVESCETRL